MVNKSAPKKLKFLVLALCMSWSNWAENKSLNRSVKFSKSCVNGIREIVSNRAVLLCGTLQALFEAVISIFVFLWVSFPAFLSFFLYSELDSCFGQARSPAWSRFRDFYGGESCRIASQ